MTIDKNFMTTYTLNKNYSTQIVRTNESTNEWTAYLYNYKTATWDTLFTQSGTDQMGLAEGWDLYELYTNLKPNGQSYACADLKGKRVESQDIQVKIGSTWEVADPTQRRRRLRRAAGRLRTARACTTRWSRRSRTGRPGAEPGVSGAGSGSSARFRRR